MVYLMEKNCYFKLLVATHQKNLIKKQKKLKKAIEQIWLTVAKLFEKGFLKSKKFVHQEKSFEHPAKVSSNKNPEKTSTSNSKILLKLQI